MLNLLFQDQSSRTKAYTKIKLKIDPYAKPPITRSILENYNTPKG